MPAKRLISSDVEAAAAAIPAKITMKTAFFFGIQTLTSLCDPSTGLFAQNARDALSLKVVERIAPALEKFADDEQIPRCILTIFNAMAYTLANQPDEELANLFIKQGGVAATIKWIQTVPDTAIDRVQLEKALDVIKLLGDVAWQSIKQEEVAPPLVSKVLDENLSPKLAASLLELASYYVRGQPSVKVIAKADGTKRLLEYLEHVDSFKGANTRDVVSTAVLGLYIVQRLVEEGQWDKTGDLGRTIVLADQFQENVEIHNAVKSVLVLMVSEETIRSTITKLSKDVSVSERNKLLAIFTPLSHLPDICSVIYAENGVPVIVSLIERICGEIEAGSTDEATITALAGACKALAGVAEDPSHISSILNAGGLAALASASQVVNDYPMAVAACCSAITPLVREQGTAEHFLSSGGFEGLKTAVEKNPEVSVLVMSLGRVISAICSNKSCAQYIADSAVMPLFNRIVQSDNLSTTAIRSVYGAITMLFDGLTSSASAVESSYIENTHATVTKHEHEALLLLDVAKSMQSLTNLPGGNDALAARGGINTLVFCLKTTTVDSDLFNVCCKALRDLVKEDHLSAAWASTQSALGQAAENPDAAVGSLVVLAAASRIPRLAPAFASRKIRGSLLSAAMSLLQDADFPRRDNVLSAVFNSVGHPTDSASAVNSILELLEFAGSEPMQSALQKTMDTKVLTDCFDMCIRQSALVKASSDEYKQLLNAVSGLIRKYSDNRMAVVKLLELMAQIVRTDRNKASSVFLELGCHTQVVGLARRVRMWLDLQVAAFKCLDVVLGATGEDGAAQVRQAGGIDMVKAAQQAHGRSPKLREVLISVAGQLMPASYIEDQIREAQIAANEAMSASNNPRLVNATDELLLAVSTPEGARAAVRLGLASTLASITAYARKLEEDTKGTENETVKTLSSNVLAIAQLITTSSAGARAASKTNLPDSVTKLVEDLIDVDPVDRSGAVCDGLDSLANMSKANPTAERDTSGLLKRTSVFSTANKTNADALTASAKWLATLDPEALEASSEFGSFVKMLVTNLESENAESVDASLLALNILAESNGRVNKLLQKFMVEEAALKALRKPGHVKRAAELLSKLTSEQSHLRKMTPNNRQNRAVEIARAVEQSQDVAVAHAGVRALRNIIECESDVNSWSEMATIARALRHAALLLGDDAEAKADVGMILNKIGGDASTIGLIEQITQIATTKPDHYELQLRDLLEELTLYLASSLQSPSKVFKPLGAMTAALKEVLDTKMGDTALVFATFRSCLAIGEAAVACDRPRDALVAFESVLASLSPIMAKTLHWDTHEKQPLLKEDNIVIAAYDTFTCFLKDDSVRRKIMAQAKETNMTVTAFYLKDNTDNDEVIEAINRYFAALALDREGLQLLEYSLSLYKKSERGLLRAMMDEMMDTILKGKGKTKIGLAAMDLLASMLRTSPEYRKQFQEDREMQDQLETAAAMSLARRLAALKLLAGATQQGNQDWADEIVGSHVDRLKIMLDGDLTEQDKKFAIDKIIEILTIANEDAVSMAAFKRSGLVDQLCDLFGRTPTSVTMWKSVVRPLTVFVKDREDVAPKIAKCVVPKILADLDKIKEDPELLQDVLELFLALGLAPGIAFNIAQMDGYQDLLEVWEKLAEVNPEFKERLELWKRACAEDLSDLLTLQKVEAAWQQEQQQEVELTLQSVQEHLDFVFEKMTEYCGTLIEDENTNDGRELKAGCGCFELLSQYPENGDTCLEYEEESILMSGLSTQTTQNVLQFVVDAGVAVTSDTQIAAAMNGLSEGPGTLARVLREGRGLGEEYANRSEMITSRLILIRQIAGLNRNFMDGTDVMNTIIRIWYDYYEGWGDDLTVREDFKCMRAIVNENWVSAMEDLGAFQRMIQEIRSPEVKIGILPDMFFVIGHVASLGTKTRDMLGNIGMVEAITDFVERYKDQVEEDTEIAMAVCNGLLALGVLCLAHVKNVTTLKKIKGLEMSVQLMKRANAHTGVSYDLANAAGNLLSNASFHRDDIKRNYAELEAPAIIMDIIRQYDGGEEPSQLRCMSSMFRAIGNLSVYTPNIKVFVDGGVAECLADFITSSTSGAPLSVLENGLRCLHNLVTENDATLAAFEVDIIPLCQLLGVRASDREAANLLFLGLSAIVSILIVVAYMILPLCAMNICLCRQEATCVTVINEGAISFAAQLAETSGNTRILGEALNLVATVALHENLIPTVVEHGGMSLAVDTLKFARTSAEASADLVIQACMCVRRLTTDVDAVRQFCDDQGVAYLLETFNGLTADEYMAAMHAEGYRVLLKMLELCPVEMSSRWYAKNGQEAPGGGAAAGKYGEEDEDWGDEAVPEEEPRGGAAKMAEERPGGVRAWEQVGFTPLLVRNLIELTCSTLGTGDLAGVNKLVMPSLGLLCYFSCERVPEGKETFLANNFLGLVPKLVNEGVGNENLIEMIIIILANLASECTDEELPLVVQDAAIKKAIRGALTRLPKKGNPEIKQDVKDFVTFLDASNVSQSDWGLIGTWDFDFTLSEFNVEKYANGVQDMPTDLKKNLREGGFFYVCDETNVKGVKCRWQASPELHRLVWHEGDEIPVSWAHSLPMSRLSLVHQGKGSEFFQQKSRLHFLAMSRGKLMVLRASTENGNEEVNIRFSSKKERDKFVSALAEWREAISMTY